MSVHEKAVARIVGYSDRSAERTRINRLIEDLQSKGWHRPLPAAVDRFLNTLNTSHDIDEVRAALDAREAARADDAAYREIDGSLRISLRNLGAPTSRPSETDVAPALEYLHGQLGKLISRVRELDRALGRVSSIEEAIRDDDHLTLWRELEEAADRYGEIRQSQALIVGMVGLDSTDKKILVDQVGPFVNAFDRDAGWIERRKTSYRRSIQDETFREWVETPPRAPWDWPSGSTWPDGVTHAAALRWFANNAPVWVPTFEQMRSVVADMKILISPLPDLAHVRWAFDAFDRYYTQRGVKPVSPFDVAAARAALPNVRGLHANRDADGRTHADPRILALIGE